MIFGNTHLRNYLCLDILVFLYYHCVARCFGELMQNEFSNAA